MQYRHILVGGDDIDTVGFHPHPVSDLENLHIGDALEQFGHDTFVCRIKVLDDDKCDAARMRHMAQELFQRLQTASGGTDADNRERETLSPR